MFRVGNCEHTPDDRRCVECWSNFPKPCECGGFIHAQFLKDHWDGGLNIAYACDNCGDQYKDRTIKPVRPKKYKSASSFRKKK